MTIQIINPVSMGHSDLHVFTNVVSCTDDMIVLSNGDKYYKRVCAKVKLLSLLDFDGKGVEEFEKFMNDIGADCRQYVTMTKAEFNSLDLLTRI